MKDFFLFCFERLKIKNTAGFTLIELLIAVSISTIVVTFAGYGLVSVLRDNQKINNEVSARQELNKALDFIAEETRTASAISTNLNINLSTVSPTFFSKQISQQIHATNITPVLGLKLPSLSKVNVNEQVIYYIADPYPSSIWRGPKVIYRWGPDFKDDGTYDTNQIKDPTKWTVDVALVDQIVNSTSIPNCKNSSPSPAPLVQGFYACVDSTGRTAEIHLIGQINKANGSSSQIPLPYEVINQVLVRSY